MKEERFLPLVEETKAFRELREERARGKQAHAYLILCSDRIFLKAFLRAAAAAAVCPQGGCFRCGTCKRIWNGTFSDVISYPKEREKILVEDISALTEEAYVRPLEGDRKIFLLNDADKMNAAAQNKLLKTLEEPPEHVTIFLGAANEANVLFTVRSRCRILTVERFCEERVVSYLVGEGVSAERAEILAAGCFGNVGEAEKMVFDDEYPQLYETVFRVLKETENSKDALKAVSELAVFKDRFREVLDVMTSAFRDALVVGTCPEFVLSRRKKDDILRLSEKYSSAALLYALDRIADASRKWEESCNFNAVADQLILGILEGKALCRKS